MLVVFLVIELLRGKKEPADKDPNDRTNTPYNSTHWEGEHNCPECLAEKKYLSPICGNCGVNNDHMWLFRSHRKIWHRGKWMHQYIYHDEPLPVQLRNDPL
jgi:hypothetical protein